jgi:lysyl-tRNA synthetase class 2
MTEASAHPDHQGERDVRIAKIQKIKDMGIIPFAQSFDKKDLIGDIIKNYETKEHRDINDIIPEPKMQVQTAGRLMLYRSHGKLAFAKLLDSTDEIQLMFHRDNCKIIVNDSPTETLKQWDLPTGQAGTETPSAYKFMEKMVDMGDFIGVK